MIDLLQKAHAVGQRLAAAGREARSASADVTSQVTEQMTQTLGAAAGEVVRAAVCGAVAAIIRGARAPLPTTTAPIGRFRDPWGDDDDDFHTEDRVVPVEPVTSPEPNEPAEPSRPGWAEAARMTGTALTVAAGAAASVPGGRLVAAGLGAAAAVVTLAARAGENSSR
jgi:hypothetical protein